MIAGADETCWLFAAHGSSSPGDTSKFDVANGESYSQFYYDVPWPAGSVATRFGAQLVRTDVVRHALVFSSNSMNAHGTVARNVTGTTIGEEAELLAAWTPGACHVRYPDDVGGKLPERGKIMVQWHHLNESALKVNDASAMVICSAPAGTRKHVGGLTMLGTEDLSLEVGKSQFSSTCVNDSGAPITVLGFMPHMRALGRRMETVAHDDRAGTAQAIFDQPFSSEQQAYYMFAAPYVLPPGSALKSTCTYQNDTGQTSFFGQSAFTEVCYQLAFTYPHGALNNGAPSLIGATNTCW